MSGKAMSGLARQGKARIFLTVQTRLGQAMLGCVWHGKARIFYHTILVRYGNAR
jgi:hypothetical protein